METLISSRGFVQFCISLKGHRESTVAKCHDGGSCAAKRDSDHSILNLYNLQFCVECRLWMASMLAADAENEDNISEQRRQHGKRVRYGEIIQLKHVFSNKYIHVSTTQTSRRDKNNMLIYLQNFNAKHAQFRLLPRYKVKSEGEFVQVLDQIILESFKSLGQFFHASTAWKIDHFNTGSELNLGIQPAGFTVVKSSRPSKDIKDFVTGGSVIRLFHKELEAYLVAEGLYDDEVTEDVHLRIREVDQLVPKSLYPSTSGNTYWQIEGETSVLNGDVIRWEQQIRLRHMTTRQYLCITSARKVSLIDDWKDPRTVFRLHPVIKESDEISFESYSRIEHVITGYWLHALRDEEYIRRQHREKSDESKNSMKNLRWDGASLRKRDFTFQISASGEKMYHDAYTLQKVEDQHVRSFNFVSGMAPFLLNLIKDALQELKSFMLINNVASKKHQKLMRNLRIIDLLVKILKSPLLGAIDQSHLTKVFKAAYDVLYVYMIGDSRKNSLYFAKYIDFFQTQITVKIGDIGLNVAQMIVELIRDNRKIVDRISHEQIEMFVSLLKINKASFFVSKFSKHMRIFFCYVKTCPLFICVRYLDLLNVLCVCDGVAISDNQVYITEHWLRRDGCYDFPGLRI
ncbi:hypothetical protein HELRODRAFT_162842 [Helobdella robusta]|uniref:Inositol 1,4,5-trisphosphate receptor n=1 Tax=Helobdella robusta TaxID=6412 RepID=T1ET91_HELRO|nr:hypothetical protein HELRODRAFT_162842 [Helobdella robusta]ESN99319.1 hypothetical protein HELRODRAFT_162842 [Helobdella robusta]